MLVLVSFLLFCLRTLFLLIVLLMRCIVVELVFVHQVRYGGGGCIRQDPVRSAHGAAGMAGGGPVQQTPPRTGGSRPTKNITCSWGQGVKEVLDKRQKCKKWKERGSGG